MNYYAKKETIYTTTKYEKLSKGKLRKISILKNIPFKEWSNLELEDLIMEYEIYFLFIKPQELPVSILEFLRNGLYENESLFEELKSSELDSQMIQSSKIKSIKLKKINS